MTFGGTVKWKIRPTNQSVIDSLVFCLFLFVVDRYLLIMPASVR